MLERRLIKFLLDVSDFLHDLVQDILLIVENAESCLAFVDAQHNVQIKLWVRLDFVAQIDKILEVIFRVQCVWTSVLLRYFDSFLI